jgi:hypothetical protein
VIAIAAIFYYNYLDSLTGGIDSLPSKPSKPTVNNTLQPAKVSGLGERQEVENLALSDQTLTIRVIHGETLEPFAGAKVYFLSGNWIPVQQFRK